MGSKGSERSLPSEYSFRRVVANFCLYQGNYYNTRESVDYVFLKDADGIVRSQGDESLND